MIKINFISILLILMSIPVFSQQDIQLSQFQSGSFIYNPAVTGTGEALNISAFYRSQWAGMPGQPVTQSISAEMPVYSANSGGGIFFVNDAIGEYRDLIFRAAYAYHINLGNSILSLGINGGIVQKTLDGSRLISGEGVYENGDVRHLDPVIPENMISGTMPDAGIGVFFMTGDFQAGISVNHILEPAIRYELNDQSGEYRLKRSMNVHAGNIFRISEKMDLQPGILLKSDLIVHQLDLNLMAIYNKNIWGGLSYRGYNNYSHDAVIAMMGMSLTENISFGYSYDFSVSRLREVNSGSHEIFLNYNLPISRPSVGKIISNPRFLM